MKTLVLVFHPNMAASRVNRALAERAESLGDDVVVHRMYDLYPGFRIDIAAERWKPQIASSCSSPCTGSPARPCSRSGKTTS